MGNAHESVENYDKLDISLVCLGNEQSSERLIKMLSIALSNTMDGEQKIRNLTDMGLKMTRTSERGMWEMCNYSKGILEKGLTEGLEKGKLDAYVDAVKKLTACLIMHRKTRNGQRNREIRIYCMDIYVVAK